jgi:integrase
MASWKDPRTKKYRYRFEFQGKRYNKGPFPTKKAARTAEAEHRARLEKGQEPAPETISEPKPSDSGYETLDLEELMVMYLQFAERKLGAVSLRYRKTVFRRFLKHQGDVAVAAITAEMIENYLLKTSTNNQFNKERTELMVLFSWAYKRHHIPNNPVTLVEKLGVDQRKKVIPTPQEMKKILMAAGKDRPLIQVLLHTLARIDEVLRLKWEDINWERHEIRLWTRKRRGGAWQFDWLPMNEELEGVLRVLWQKREQEEWVFFNSMTGTRYLYRPKLMKTICKTAGVKTYGFHTIRHFAASYLYDKMRRPLPEISKLLRHTNYQTTERYLQLVDPNLRETMRLLEGFAGGLTDRLQEEQEEVTPRVTPQVTPR